MSQAEIATRFIDLALVIREDAVHAESLEELDDASKARKPKSCVGVSKFCVRCNGKRRHIDQIQKHNTA
jgi:hypothetical protein